MTREEAIEILQKIKPIPHRGDSKSTTHILETIALDMAIKALEQQSCEDCISREAVLEILEKEEFKGDAIYEIEKKLPPVTPTRPTGKWIDIGNEGLVFKCSLCGNKNTIESHYCGGCGARMQEVEE